jgi:anti-sigma factor RsiW
MAELQPLSDAEREELIAYLDGELDAATGRAIEAKLNRDPRLRREADALRKSYALLDYLPRPDPSPNFTNRTMTRVSAAYPGMMGGPVRPAWRRWAVGLGWAAAVLVAGVVGYAGAPLLYRTTPAGETATDQELLVRDLRVVDNLRPYQNVNDINFLHEIDRPELFGDEHAGF